MKIGVLGASMVGAAVATKLVPIGHQVKMGSRSAKNESETKWAEKNGTAATQGTFADAACGEIVINCTNRAKA